MLKKIDHIDKEPDAGAVTIPDKPSGTASVRQAIMRGGLQLAVMVAVLALAFAGMSWLITNKDEPAKHPAFKTVYTVDTLIAKSATFQPSMIVYGEVQAARSVELRSLVAGEIVAINPALRVGTRLEKGQPLIEIDRFSYEGALSEAEANRQETRARIAENNAMISIEASKIKSLRDQLGIAGKDLARISQLKTRGTATIKQVEDRELIVSQRSQALEQSELNLVAERAKLEQQKAILTRLDWRVEQAGRFLKDTVLVAPFSGVISQSSAEVGRMVGANDLVVSMYDADQLDVRFTLTDARFGRISADPDGVTGRAVEVIWIVGGREYRFAAVIDRIGAEITSNRGGVEVYARLGGAVRESPLRPGAFVEVIVPDAVFDAHFKIPETALYDGDTVYVVRDEKLVRREVRIAARDGDAVILTGGLTDGDEVLLTRITEISEGLKVRAESSKPGQPEHRNTGQSE